MLRTGGLGKFWNFGIGGVAVGVRITYSLESPLPPRCDFAQKFGFQFLIKRFVTVDFQ
ncbi:hypothetical protein VDGD_20786 [Verticillium dahliae]|nr:hypothetical protein VDGD_20786 [Verticillium dahliae]